MKFSIAVHPDYVVHIGAGYGTDIETYEKAGVESMLLVEADPEAAEALRNRTQGMASAQVIEAAVNGSGGEQTFYKSSFSALSGLLPPSPKLENLFPGARLTSSTSMEATSASDLLQSAPLPQEGTGLLVVETPGVALEIVRSLVSSGKLNQFSALRIQESVEPLYLGAPKLSRIRDELEMLGYFTFQDLEKGDPARPHLVALSRRYCEQAHDTSPQSKSGTRAITTETDTLRRVMEGTEQRLTQGIERIPTMVGALVETTKQETARAEQQDRLLSTQLHSLKLELSALRQQFRAPTTEAAERTRTLENGRQVFVVAGVPRSGSTWVYNAIRLLCQKAGKNLYSTWVSDYKPQEHDKYAVHLVKLHNREDLSFEYTHLFTTHRDLTERLASILRMGWLQDDPDKIRAAANGHAKLHAYWAALSDFEAQYDEIMNAPEVVLGQLALCLGLNLPATVFSEVARTLAVLPTPERGENASGHDKETLLHVGHRASEEERNKILAHVRDILANAK